MLNSPQTNKMSVYIVRTFIRLREMALTNEKFGKLDNHKQEPWKAPLPIFFEGLYFKRFGKKRPEIVRSIEQMVKYKKKKQLERKQRKQRAKENSQQDSGKGLG